MKRVYWIVWGVLTLTIVGYFLNMMLYAEDKTELIIGEASHGHYQIEMACTSCHTESFGGEDMLQKACVDCHGDQLKTARDSHPKKKFTDPRNADLVDILDARYCVSCHTEHQNEQTHAMGLTLPGDYCFHCHETVGDDRESHKDLGFETCASAGCHNFHDNRALFEDFLAGSAEQPWVAAMSELVHANAANKKPKDIKQPADYFEAKKQQHPDIEQEWLASRHGEVGVECGSCHADETASWIEKPALSQCQSCHTQETEGYLQGKHGMRIAVELSPLTPSMSQMAFKQDMLDAEHGCNSCHASHSFDRKFAAFESCVSCHDDDHTRAFESSPHGQLTRAAMNDELPWEQAVTCATCHMPRLLHGKENSALDPLSIANFKGNALIKVQHNQSDNLRPNEKMIRPICMSCHSLSFSIDALADTHLINNNFNGKPESHVPSIDWAKQRLK